MEWLRDVLTCSDFGKAHQLEIGAVRKSPFHSHNIPLSIGDRTLSTYQVCCRSRCTEYLSGTEFIIPGESIEGNYVRKRGLASLALLWVGNLPIRLPSIHKLSKTAATGMMMAT